MSAGGSRLPARGTVCALLICAAMLGTGVALALLAPHSPITGPFALPVLVLVPLYVASIHFSIDFELRQHSHSVFLTQIPLTLGAVLVAPGAHLACRLAATVGYSLARRQAPMKAAYNASAAAFDVGAIAVAVSWAPVGQHPGIGLWVALYAGLLVAELITNSALYPVWWFLGIPVTWADLRARLAAALLTSTVFAGLAVVTLLSLWTEPASAGLILLLAGGLSLAYRAHRRLTAQQGTTEQLYEFVKDLGPLSTGTAHARQVLEHVRELLQAGHLDLALTGPDGSWRHVVVAEAEEAATDLTDDTLAARVLRTKAPALLPRQVGDPDRMATPLIGSLGVLGVLTASDRLGSARDYDMGDLRLLETIATELATALERGQLLADLERAATTDPLTELPNLAETTRLVTELLARGDVLIAAVSVESFREVNDQLGHQLGDALLVEVTRRLREAAPAAVLGRIGGGRFAVAVPAGVGGHDPEMLGLDLRARVEGNAQIGAIGTHIRLAVGVVQAPTHGTEAATLLRRAETAMHGARDAHGGPVTWEPAYEIKGQRRLAVVTALREALSSGAIGVAYQPKVEAGSGRVTGVEALARWTHPALGAITPDEFIPLAEASGLMRQLTTSILHQSLTACRGWQRRGGAVGVSVNVSADTVLHASFVTQVAEVLAEVGLPADRLTLELTEDVVVADPVLAAERMGELRALGVKISVDDFGTGYSSLTYLKGLPVDEVKIDKGFVDHLATDPADRAVVRAVVDIAHTLGLRVVAEGVEEQHQHDLLLGLGVDEIQGYLHARPMPALGTGQWLRKREIGIHAG